MLKNMLRRFQISIRLTLVSLFLIATSLTAIIAIGLHYYFSMSFASESARNSFQITAKYGHMDHFDRLFIYLTPRQIVIMLFDTRNLQEK